MRKILLLMLLLCSDAWATLSYKTYAGTGAYPSMPYYGTGQLYYPTVLSTGTVANINYNWGGGYVLDSGRHEQVIVNFYGYITIPGSGSQTIYFYSASDDGFYLRVNNSTVINNWVEQGVTYYNGSGSIVLQGGQSYYIDAWMYENGGGAAAMLYWNTGSGITVVPSSALTTTMPAGSGGGGSYTSNITNSQQTNINANRSRTTALNNGNEIYIDQVGNNNTTTITQKGNNNKITGTTQQTATISGNSNSTTIRQNSGTGKNLIDLNVTGTGSNTLNLNQGYLSDGTLSGNQLGNNYQKVDVQGNNNSLTTQQNRDVGTAGNYMEHTVIGNYNSITSTQSGDNKLLFNSITGNNNTVSTTQSGTGAQHYIDLTLNGNGNSATVNQSGTTQNKATIVINNLGGSAGVDLTQTGGQTYNITTNCVTLGGCGTTTVSQGN